MTSKQTANSLNHPILEPLSYEKYDPEKVLASQVYDSTPSQWKLPPLAKDSDIILPEHQGGKTRSKNRLMVFLKSKTPAAKMNALQAQQERERVEMMDEYISIALWVIAICAVASSLSAMSIYSENGVLKAAFLFPLITAPYAVVQRRQINKAAFLREDYIRLQSRMMRLRQQNERLLEEGNQLDLQLACLEAADRDLEAILQKQGRTRKQVQNLVEENGEIAREMIQLQESHKLLQIVKMALGPDRSGDVQLNEMELNEFMECLQNMSPRKLDEDKLRKALSKSTNSGVYSIASSDPWEDQSEYEAFTFPRRPSLEK